MTIGSGIAVVGIWLGVGIISNRDPARGMFAAFFATFATMMVCAPK